MTNDRDRMSAGAATPLFPAGTVRALLATEMVTEPTRRALQPRLDGKPPPSPLFFDQDAYADLGAVCDRLIPQADRDHSIPLAAAIDARLAEGRGDGWRYDAMPEDGEAYRRGLLGLNETARTLFGAALRELDGLDLHLVRDLGLKVLRYGLPIHRVSLGPGRYDWSFADEVMRAVREMEIIPILDLLHFGLPDWMGTFQNPDFPILFADYCEAVAQRYPWVRYYTPVNEVYVTARNSGKDGIWNEQMKSDRAFVTAMKHCVAASILGNHSIAKHRSDCVIIQSESAEYIHEVRAVQSPEVTLANKQRFISLDLLYAFPPDADALIYMLDNGLTREEYAWFMQGEPPGYQILGNDYYGRNEHILKPDGRCARLRT